MTPTECPKSHFTLELIGRAIAESSTGRFRLSEYCQSPSLNHFTLSSGRHSILSLSWLTWCQNLRLGVSELR